MAARLLAQLLAATRCWSPHLVQSATELANLAEQLTGLSRCPAAKRQHTAKPRAKSVALLIRLLQTVSAENSIA